MCWRICFAEVSTILANRSSESGSSLANKTASITDSTVGSVLSFSPCASGAGIYGVAVFLDSCFHRNDIICVGFCVFFCHISFHLKGSASFLLIFIVTFFIVFCNCLANFFNMNRSETVWLRQRQVRPASCAANA